MIDFRFSEATKELFLIPLPLRYLRSRVTGIWVCSSFLLISEMTEIVFIEAIDFTSGSMKVLQKFLFLCG